ncbi:hypothetical protein DPV78_009068 [Talaromyces pinophilus]|nr:hypothetical protein DPV78_009068 [Talaromyces pinophilus]
MRSLDNPTEDLEKLNKSAVSQSVSPTTNQDGDQISGSPYDMSEIDLDVDEDPRHWPARKKMGLLVMVAIMTFITPMSPAMLASAVPEILTEFPTTNTVLASMSVSIYALGLAVGPLIIAPLSEAYGRTILYHATAILFIIFSIACAVSTNLNMLVAFEFFQGCCGSAPITMGGGSVADMYSQEERGAHIAFLAVGPLIAQFVGPVGGSFLAAARGWRWVFWLVTILTAAIEVGYCFFIRETYQPVLIRRKAGRLQKAGNTHISDFEKDISTLRLVGRSIIRPFKMLFLFPIVLGLGTHAAIGYAYFYLLITTLSEIFIATYGFEAKIVGLVYLGIAFGMAIGAALFAIFSDRMIRQRAARQAAKPEDRLVPMIAGGIALPAGLFIYGWSAQYAVHWIVPIIGTAFLGLGLIWLLLPIDTYLVDAYPLYAASSIGATTVFRSFISAFLPLAGTPMYARLGLGWGNSLLAFIAIALLPIPFLFLRYGIGFNFSEIAFSKGNHVIIADLRLTPVAEEFVKKNEATKRVVFVECDVTLWKDLQNLVTVSLREFEDVPDAYVAAAGLFETSRYSFFEDNEEERYHLMDVNASHPIKLTRIGMKASIPRNKKMVMCVVASMAGLYPLYPSPVYNASKHAVVGFIKCMKPADVEENVKIVGVCPGLVATPLWTEDLKPIWSYDQSQALTGVEVAEAVLELVEDGKYEGGTVMTYTPYAGKAIEQFVDIEALFAPLKEASYAPVRKVLKEERESGLKN